MVKITHHGYLGLCEICHAEIPIGPGGKCEHYRSQHPEVRFTSHRKGNKTLYGCGLCDRVTALANYASIVQHYNFCHPELLKGPPLLWAAVERREVPEIHNPVEQIHNPVEQVDKFFDGLTALMMEVERLRKEKLEWMQIAEKWAKRIVELQELLDRKP